MAEEIERIYVIPLKKTGFKSSKAAPTAVKRVKKYLTRHMKVEEKDIWIDDSLNSELWSKGKYNMPSKIRVKAVKFDDGVVEAYIPELEFKKSRRELLKEEKEKKEPILKKDEVEAEEADTGAEDYDIAPGADGEVKIKKKKAPKEKKPAKPKKETKKSSKKKTEPKKTERKSKPKKKPSSKSTTKKSTSKKTKK
ncbi:MAG: 50S ribosomal protein L31e [Thermoplasmatales archaeon]|nr:50S ribosomal protein L31e [Thermoplasmatales archaeon]